MPVKKNFQLKFFGTVNKPNAMDEVSIFLNGDVGWREGLEIRVMIDNSMSWVCCVSADGWTTPRQGAVRYSPPCVGSYPRRACVDCLEDPRQGALELKGAARVLCIPSVWCVGARGVIVRAVK